MSTQEPDKIYINSINAPKKIFLSGFDALADQAHMFEWLRRGADFREFVTRDVETELYSQDATSQLLSVHCKAKPSLETIVRPSANPRYGNVSRFLVSFPLIVRVRASSGIIWKLDVDLGYHAINLDEPAKFQLTLDFKVLSHQAEA
jgi:hypothetical protein